MTFQSTKNSSIGVLSLSILALVYLFANSLFYLVPFYQVKNVFYSRDVGNTFIMLCLLFCILKYQDLGRLSNAFSFLFIYYLLFAFIQAASASLRYEQSLIVGIIKTRDQLYYLSYFLYLYLLNSDRRINKFMNLLTAMGLILIALSSINYFGPNIIYRGWAEKGGSGIRSGIPRAYIPGMVIIATSFVWQLNKAINKNTLFSFPVLLSIILFGGILFRQTRMLIISSTFTAMLMFAAKKKYMIILFFIVLISISTLSSSFQTKENILVSSFRTAVEDLSEGTGTWGDRLNQIKIDWLVFRQNMLFGSGLSAIRSSVLVKKNPKLAAMAYDDDLGYTHWLKFYGIAGIAWLLIVIVLFYKRYFKIKKYLSSDRKEILEFAQYNFSLIVFANITLPYFLNGSRILITCLSLSILSTYWHNAIEEGTIRNKNRISA